jgi:hypothetical protein
VVFIAQAIVVMEHAFGFKTAPSVVIAEARPGGPERKNVKPER